MIVSQGSATVSFVDRGGQEHVIGAMLTIEVAYEPEPVILRCGCCGLPWARLENGALVVESRHSGQVHVNRLSVEALAALVAGNGATNGETNGETWGYSG